MHDGVHMKLERLTVDEGDRLRAIRLRALHDAPEAFESRFEQIAALPPESWSQQIRALATFVAVIDNHDVGLVRGEVDHDDDHAAWLLSMWVDPSARGHGVGEALIEEVILWARSIDATRMLLEVADDNAPAIRLYARMGFEPNGIMNTLAPPRDHIHEHQRQLSLILDMYDSVGT